MKALNASEKAFNALAPLFNLFVSIILFSKHRQIIGVVWLILSITGFYHHWYKNMKILRRLWFRLIPFYESLDVRCVTYERADQLMRESEKQPEEEQWVICSRLEDKNRTIGVCWIERRRRITE